MRFADVDEIIENKLKMSIRKIFQEKGEFFFRKIEEKITLDEAKKQNTIISLGGGGFMNNKIRNAILANSNSFWLDLNMKQLATRLLKSNKRPLLNDGNLKTTLDNIYSERKSTYAIANFRINCNRLNKNLITNKIIKLYEND